MSQSEFVSKPDQVDYANIRCVPVAIIVVTINGKVYCVKHSPDMRLYPECWSWVCSFLDDNQSIEAKVCEELSEELGMKPSDIESLTRGKPWIDESPERNKTWLIVPVLAKVKTDDWEASQGKWFDLEGLRELGMAPEALRTALQFFPQLL